LLGNWETANSHRQVLTNSLTLVTPTFDPIGVCFDPLAALANHSCDPNAFVVMDGPVISFRALNDIPKDQEITISYVDATNPFHRRQHELQSRHYFQCTCPKCEKGATLDQDQFLRSANRLSPEWQEIADRTEKQYQLGSKAENKVGDDSASQRLATLQGLGFYHLEAAKHVSNDEARSVLQEGIKICSQSGMFSMTRQPYASLLHDLMVNQLSLSQFVPAFRTGLRIYFDVNPTLFPQLHHPLRVVHDWTLAKIAMYLASEYREGEREASQMVKEAGLELGVIAYGFLMDVLTGLPWSHGEDCSLAAQAFQKFNEMKPEIAQVDRRLLENEREAQWSKMKSWVRRVND
jgi:hypothetical protein